MPTLDESALRRPGFEEGYAVALADGVRWTLPPVRIKFFPQDDGTLGARPWYDGDLEDDLDVIFGVEDATRPLQFAECVLRIAAALLRKNYDLPRGGAGRLLAYIPGDDASEAMLSKVCRAALGRDPDAPDRDDDEGDDPEDAPAPKGEPDGAPTSTG